MIPDQLAEIEARANAATEGGWDRLSDYLRGEGIVEPNCVLVERARQDIPDLIAYIRELEAMIGEKTGDIVDRLERNLDAAFDEILP